MKKETNRLHPDHNLMSLEKSDKSKRFEKNSRWLDAINHCQICGKFTGKSKHAFYMVNGGWTYAHPKHVQHYYNEDNGLIGWTPVGPDCVKKLSPELKEFLVTSKDFDFLKEGE